MNARTTCFFETVPLHHLDDQNVNDKVIRQENHSHIILTALHQAIYMMDGTLFQWGVLFIDETATYNICVDLQITF